MNVHNQASSARTTGRVHRPHHHRHIADCGHVELETLTAPQSRSFHDLDLGHVGVPPADAVDSIGAEVDASPVFTDSELRGCRNAANLSIAAAPTLSFRGFKRSARAGAGSLTHPLDQNLDAAASAWQLS